MKTILEITKSVKITLILTIFFFNSITDPIFAQDKNSEKTLQEDLFILPSLSELFQLKVITASKKLENIAEAPGSINSYSYENIRKLGYYSLADLANITPGFSSFLNIGEITLETRGQMASGFDNNRHLVLLDGIPINHARANTANSNHNLPVYFAKKVEFLRGPASALYGVSAFYGVINIQALDGHNVANSFESKISYGTLDEEKRLLSNLLFSSSSGNGGISLGYFEKESSDEYVGSEKSSDHKNYDDQKSTFLYSSWSITEGALSGIKLGALYTRKEGGLGNFWAGYSSNKNKITWETLVLYSKYKKRINENLLINSYLKYNHSSEAAKYYNKDETASSEYDYPFHNAEAQVELDWEISKTQNIIAGINHDARFGESDYISSNNQTRYTAKTPTIHTSSAYLQYKKTLPILNDMLVTSGLRLDNGKADAEHYYKFSPRIAIIQKLPNNYSLKLMYGEALRGPSTKEIGVNKEVLSENKDLRLPSLKPEEIRTFEIAPYYQSTSWLYSITLFHSRTKNFLGRNWGNLGEYHNIRGSTKSIGFEAELNYRFSTELSLMANYSYAKSKDNHKNELTDVPDQKARIGLLWDSIGKYPCKGSIIAKWLNQYNVSKKDEKPTSGYLTLDANMVYSISRYWELELQIKNIFNEKYHMPEAGKANIKMPGTNAMLSIGINY